MINTKTFLRFAILFGSIFLLSYQDLKATHIVGGDMTYRCLGNNTYEIKLTMRRDCFQGAPNAQFDDPASIGIFDGTTHQPLLDLIGYPGGELTISLSNNDTLNEFLHSDCSVVSGNVCVHTTMYVKNIVLPYRATGYTLAYQRCCRNGSLNNIVDPLNTGMTIVAELSATAQLECNSSPQFLAYPSIYICVNKDIDFDAHAVDFEHDSLVYSLCTPYAGGSISNNKPQPPPPPPYDLVTWKPPYNLANLLGGVPLKIDPKTGHLSGKPNAIGQYIVGYCVTAYKRGTNIITGITRRDFQYNVRVCRDVPVANFSAPSLDCSNDNLSITFDNQSILADDYLWIFDYEHKATSDTSIAFEPTYTFPHEGFFKVALIVSDSGMFCHDTIIHEVGVFNSQINAEFTYDVSSCNEDGIVINVHDQTTGFNPNFPADKFEWLLTYPGGVIPSTLQNPTFTINPDDPATVCISLVVTSTNGCSATQTECFPVRKIALAFNPDSGLICRGDSTNILLNGDSGLTYTWTPTLGLGLTDPSNPIAFPDSTTMYAVTATDGLCVVTGQTQVGVQQLPALAFSSQTDCKSLTANFTNSSIGGNLYHWDFGYPGNPGSNDMNTVSTFPDSGIYTITLSSRDGCNVSTSHQITVNAIAEQLDDQTINCFQPTIALNPDTIQGYLYIWSNGSHDANPSVTVEDDTTFYVTISSPGLPGCEIVDSIRVIIPTPFAVDAGKDTTNCKVGNVPLTATLTGISASDVDFTWIANGIPQGNTQTIIVNPDVSTTYYVTATDSLTCSKTDSVTIYKSDPGFKVHVFPEGDTTYCDQQIITLTATSIPGVTFAWFNADNVNIGSGPTIEGTPRDPTCYYVIGTDTLGCQNMDSVCLTPTSLSLGITGGQGICLDGQATICVTNNHPEQNITYLWNTDAVTSCITVSPSVTTPYSAIVTNADLGCSDTLSSIVTVHLFDPVDVIITSSLDTVILGGPIQPQLFVNQDPTFGYTWNSSGGDDVSSVWNPNVTPTIAGDVTYTVTVVNAEGCIGIASFTLKVLNPPCNDEDIFLPTAFTPNGDGVNDMLFVRSNFISTMELHIYNRWGQQVFETTNQLKGWDGTFKGERLSPDVFGYYMNITCPNGRSFSKKGNITLLE